MHLTLPTFTPPLSLVGRRKYLHPARCLIAVNKLSVVCIQYVVISYKPNL